MHRHRHIVQTSCKKDSNGKHTNDRTILIISFSQYEWTDSVTEVPNKIIINDILTPFIVSSNTHITDVLLKEVLIKEALIKEALTDAPLLIIKENINCSNFLNKDRFNFLTDRVNYKSLTDFPQSIIVVDGRLYGEALFHIFSQNETYSKTYKTDRIMADFVKFLNSNHSDIDRFHYDYSYTTTHREHKGVEKKVCFIIYKNDFLIKHFKGILKKLCKEMFIFKILFQDIMIYQLILLPKANCKLI